MIPSTDLRRAEADYADAPAGQSEPARLARRRIVAAAAGSTDEHGVPWTHRRIATELGKSAGWVGQLLAGGKEKAGTEPLRNGTNG